MKKICLVLVLYLVFSHFTNAFANTPFVIEQPPEVLSESAILMNVETGEILYEKSGYTRLYPASITKIMTMILALEEGTLSDTVTFSYDAVFSIERGSSHIAIDFEEQVNFLDCLYGIALRSANEASNGIAEHIDGSTEIFAAHMNQRAKELGAMDTHFVNPHGLPDENHYTTAYDMAVIARHAIQIPMFEQLISTYYYEIPPTNKQEETRFLYNTNQLITPGGSFLYEYCIGGKTGYTDDARHTLVAFARKDGMTLVAVLMKGEKNEPYTDAIHLFDYAFDNYAVVNLLSGGSISKDIPIDREITSIGHSVKAESPAAFYALIPKDYNPENITLDFDIPETLNRSVQVGDVLGHAFYYYDGALVASMDLTAAQRLDIEAFEGLSLDALEKERAFPYYLLLVGLGILFIILLVTIIRVCYAKTNRRNYFYLDKKTGYKFK